MGENEGSCPVKDSRKRTRICFGLFALSRCYRVVNWPDGTLIVVR